MIQTKHTVATQCKHGLMAYFMTDDPIGTCLFLYGEWAEQELELFSRLVKKNSSCIDVGANLGTHTLWLSQNCPEGFVFSIEPQFYIFQLLNTNLILNDATNCIPIRSFVMNESGKIKTSALFLPPKDNQIGKINYGQFNIKDYVNENGIITDIIRLDDIDYMGKKIDFIKMDCEGNERDVLLSGQKTINENKPHMYLEFNNKLGNDDLIYSLNDLGYKCYWHVYTKYNKNNFKQYDKNVYLYEDQQDALPTHSTIDSHFEGNIVCIHKSHDVVFDEEVRVGDNIVNYLLRHKIIK